MTEKPFILLVEDSPDDAYFFQRALRRTGIECVCRHALNGSEAVDILLEGENAQRLPVAVFVDLKMPVMNGFELLEWIQQQRFASRLPVFVLSGSNQQDDRDRASSLKAADYLVKPVTSEDLVRRLVKRGKLTEEVSL